MGGRIAILLAFIFCCSSSYAEAVEIPLENIWGYDRARRELEPKLFIKLDTAEKQTEYSTPEKEQELLDKARSSLTWQIEQAMNNNVLNLSQHWDPMKAKPATCFAVTGDNYQAWQGIYDVVVKKEKPKITFSQDDEVSLVFFHLITNTRPRLIQANIHGKTIDLKYVLVSTGRLGLYHSLWVIPLGKLSPGRYQINPFRAYAEEARYNTHGVPAYDKGTEQVIICKRSEFTITKVVSGLLQKFKSTPIGR